MSKSMKSLPQLKHGSEGSSQCGGHCGRCELKLKLIQTIVYPLWYRKSYVKMGFKQPICVLMYGPSRSKATIVKALATESKVNFVNIKVPELFPNCVDESENAVRVVFRKAKLFAPCILFIDEIDTVVKFSSNGIDSNVRERVLVQLLTELDGDTPLGGVVVIGATNRRLDPYEIPICLIRRFAEESIFIGLSDEKTRQWIFDIKLRNMPIAEDVNVANLVDLTEDYTGAEIEAICHGAAMKALEENINAAIVTKEHFKAALATVNGYSISCINFYKKYMNETS